MKVLVCLTNTFIICVLDYKINQTDFVKWGSYVLLQNPVEL